jgi:hypothetical protein
VRPAAAAGAAGRGAADGVLFAGMPSACVPPPGRAGVGDDRGRAPPPGPQDRLSGWQAGSVPGLKLRGILAGSGRVLRHLLVLCLAFNRVVPDSVNRAR